MRSLLSSVSTTTVIILIVGGSAALAVAGGLVARRVFPNLADSAFEDVADGLRVVYELVFALVLAFVIASVPDNAGEVEWTLVESPKGDDV